MPKQPSTQQLHNNRNHQIRPSSNAYKHPRKDLENLATNLQTVAVAKNVLEQSTIQYPSNQKKNKKKTMPINIIETT